MKIGPVGTELFHADKHTENHDAATSAIVDILHHI